MTRSASCSPESPWQDRELFRSTIGKRYGLEVDDDDAGYEVKEPLRTRSVDDVAR